MALGSIPGHIILFKLYNNNNNNNNNNNKGKYILGQSEFSPRTPSEDSPRVLVDLGLSLDCPWTVLGLNSDSDF